LELLNNTDELTEEERKEMEEHAYHSYTILNDLGEEALAEIVLNHHKFQPHPYPSDDFEAEHGIVEKKEKISKNYLIIEEALAFADKVDAMLSERSYQKPLSEKEAEKILKRINSGLDNKIQEKVINIMINLRKTIP